jgi:hypothetical protein
MSKLLLDNISLIAGETIKFFILIVTGIVLLDRQGPGTGETKKAAIMEFLKNAIGVGELAFGSDIVDEAEFVAGLDQAAEGVLRALKATHSWQKAFGSISPK